MNNFTEVAILMFFNRMSGEMNQSVKQSVNTKVDFLLHLRQLNMTILPYYREV